MASYELNLRDYWRIIKKKRIIVIVTVVMLGSFSFFFAMMNKPTPMYQSTASLKIEKSTDLTGMYMQSFNWYAGDEMATRGEEIKSIPIVMKAAQIMGLLDSTLTDKEITSNPEYFEVVDKLKARIKTEQEGLTNIIHIKVTDYDPQRTSDLANALAQVYIEESFQIKNSKAINAMKAITNQLAQAERNYQNTEKKIRAYKNQNNLLLLEGTTSRLSTELTVAQGELEELRSDINQIDNILFEIDQNPDYIYYISFDLLLNRRNTVLTALQSQLNQLSTDERQYLQHYTENHPTVTEVHRQIESKQRRFIEELKTYRETLVQTENNIYERWKKLSTDYRSIPLLDFTLQNIEREMEINKNLYQNLEGRNQEALIKKSELVNEVFLIKPAFLPTKPINPTMIGPTTAIGAVIGIILGVILAFVAETLDTTFSTIDDIERTLDTTVLGIVPFVDIEDIKAQLLEKIDSPISDEILEMQARLVSHYNPKSTMAEAFRALRTNIHFGLMDKGYKCMMVTSSVASEGKTTIAVNLAVSMAQIGLNTILVEADLRKPRISKLFGIDREPGLTDVVLRRDDLDSVIRTMSDLMMGTMATDTFRTDNIPGIEYLNILTAGKHERNPSEIIASKVMDKVISDLKERYDLIIFDTAPVIQATDSTVLASKVDTTLLTYYQGKISRGTLRRSKNQLEMLKADVLGVCINGMRADVSADYADYRYGYEYQYSYGDKKELVQKNKILEFLEKTFVNQQEGLHSTILDRIRKWRVAAVLGAIIALFSGSCVITGGIKSCVQEKSRTVITETQSLIDSTYDMIPEAIVSEFEPETVVPEELKNLQEQYNVQKQTIVEQASSMQESIKSVSPGTQFENVILPPTLRDNVPVRPVSQQTMTTQVPISRPLPVEDVARIKRLIPSTPYSIRIASTGSLASAKNYTLSFLQEGLNDVFITVEFTGPNSKQYIVCYGNYQRESDATQKLLELQFLGFQGEFVPVNLPYSILLGEYRTEDQAKSGQRNYTDVKDFAYLKSNQSVVVSLAGAFASEDIANLFLQQFINLQDKQIVIR
ncbi:polysaccharide biosynthesis tyrosine autokinase [bacterium]|nr:polysaccharide biosynthesis tyrosine autokinase [bacterium]MBU1874974.1 polysaccharide biosynthesis tyrosine autokinase [bacterium]